MPFDMGFNFRATSGYVTDPAYGVPVLGEAYPHTYTNTNGNSINAGWTVGPGGTGDRNAGVDVRVAGINYITPGNTGTFQADLSSGSNPGSGDYTIDLAAGDHFSAWTYDSFLVKDNTTTLISFSGTTSNPNNYFDATGTNRSPGTGAWNGVTSAKTFATTTVVVTFGTASTYSTLAHFRLTLTSAAQSVVPVLMAQYRQRRN